MKGTIRVTVWNEFIHEKRNPKVAEIYPKGIHETLARFLGGQANIQTRTATLEEPDHGLTEDVLKNTDVLIWWGHIAHARVRDEVVERIHRYITTEGIGLIALHSSHFSKIFRRLMGTSCALRWREIGEKERLWTVGRGHPIANGIGDFFELEHTEMYGEAFDIPPPDELVFISWFAGGEVFRSGCCFYRGKGKIFYFRPGHESFPIYHNPEVLTIIKNAVLWSAKVGRPKEYFGHSNPLEKIS